MCDFGAISGPMIAMMVTSVVVSAASATASIMGQQQKQKQEAAYQTKLVQANEKQMQENRDLATKAYLDQTSAANTQLAETREATAAANFDKSRQANEARGQVLASAAESGVQGVSLNALLADFHRQEDMFRSRNETNLLFKQQANVAQVEGFYTEATGRSRQIRRYTPGPIAPVDYVGPALSVVQTGVNSYMNASNAATAGSRRAT